MSAETAHHPITPLRRFMRSVCSVAAVAVVLVVVAFLLFTVSLGRNINHEPPVVDGIVVVTGGADRIHEALRLLAEGKGRRLFISGVNVHASQEMLKRNWPSRAGLFDCCIDLDYQARNTFDNAVETRRWLTDHGFRSLILVTASYHMPRTQLEFETLMPGVVIHPHPVVPEDSQLSRWWLDPTLARIMVMEFIKYSAAVLRTTLGLPGRAGISA